jgi:hypothetical protein
MVEEAIRHYCPPANREGKQIYRSLRRKIRARLHPDRVQDPALKERYEEATKHFNQIAGLDKYADPEPKHPKGYVPWEDTRKVPRKIEEWVRKRPRR